MSGDTGKGASLFTYDERLPHNYPDFVYNRMAMDYWTSRYQGQYVDPITHEHVETKGPVRRDFPEAARLYAQHHKPSGPEAAQLLTQRCDSLSIV